MKKKRDDKEWSKDVYRIWNSADSPLARKEQEASRRLAKGHMRQRAQKKADAASSPAGETGSPSPAGKEPSRPKETIKVRTEWHFPNWHDIKVRIRRWWIDVLHGSDPYSTQPPEELVLLIQVVRDEPKFYHWFMILVHCTRREREGQISQMVAGLERSPNGALLSEAVRLLREPRWFEMARCTIEELRAQEGPEVRGRDKVGVSLAG